MLIDLYSRRVVGWSMDRRMTKALVVRALIMAITHRLISLFLGLSIDHPQQMRFECLCRRYTQCGFAFFEYFAGTIHLSPSLWPFWASLMRRPVNSRKRSRGP